MSSDAQPKDGDVVPPDEEERILSLPEVQAAMVEANKMVDEWARERFRDHVSPIIQPRRQ